MKYVQIAGSFGLDSLQIAEKAVPRPGPGQVLVRVRACSLNFRDLRVAQGLYDPRMPLPRVPLSDGAGDVEEVGEGVTLFRRGDRVAGIFMQSWQAGEYRERYAASALGGAIDGMFSEYVVLHETGLVRVPEHLSHEEAATLPCAAVTAWNALMVQCRVKAGDTVLIQGTGGVSLFALQIARMAGARVIATSGSQEKLERVKQLGAAEGLNYRDVPEWGRKVREITGKTGVDAVVEVGGAGTLNQSLHACRAGGRIALIGVLAGVTAEVTTALILQKSIHIHGIYVGSREMFEEMNRALALHQIRPVIDRIFEMSDAAAAFRHMEAQAHFGKIVVRV